MPGESFPTTNEDLAGFWDMVMLQVVQVNDLFEHINKLKHSQWQEVRPDSPLSLALSSQAPKSTKLKPNYLKFISHLSCTSTPQKSIPTFPEIRKIIPTIKPQTSRKVSFDEDPKIHSINASLSELELNSIVPTNPKITKASIINYPNFNNSNNNSIIIDNSKKNSKNICPKSVGCVTKSKQYRRIYSKKFLNTELQQVMTEFIKQNKISKNIFTRYDAVQRVSEIFIAEIPSTGSDKTRADKDNNEQPLVWTQSDSQPFIPLTSEVLDNFVISYDSVPIPEPISAPMSSKLARMKKYDEQRKESQRRRKQQSAAKLNNQPQSSEKNPQNIAHDFAVQYLFSQRSFGSPYYFTGIPPDSIFNFDNYPRAKGIKYFISDFMNNFNTLLPYGGMSKRGKYKSKLTLPLQSLLKITLKPIVRYSKYFRTRKASIDDFYENESDLSKGLNTQMKETCTFLKSNRALCRLSLYLYVYGMLGLVLICLKIITMFYYDSQIYQNFR